MANEKKTEGTRTDSFYEGDIGITKLGIYVSCPKNLQMYYEKELLAGYYPKESYVKLR